MNPCEKIKRLAEENKRDRALSESEIKSVWAALDNFDYRMATLIKLLLLTAQRSGEVASMRWTDVDRANSDCWWWTIPQEVAKNKQSHRVPLVFPCIELLARMWPYSGDSEWVFPSPRDDANHVSWMRKAAKRLRDESGVDFTLHDLRRTAVSHMGGLEIPYIVLSRLLNHADPGGATPVYVRHGYDNGKREAMVVWARRIYEIIGRDFVFEEIEGRPAKQAWRRIRKKAIGEAG